MLIEYRLESVLVMDTDIGRWVQRRRVHLGMSQADLVERLREGGEGGADWTQTTLSKVERGDRSLKTREFVSIALHLDMSPGDAMKDLTAGGPLEPLIEKTGDEQSAWEDARSEALRTIEDADVRIAEWQAAGEIVDAVQHGDADRYRAVGVEALAVMTVADVLTLLSHSGVDPATVESVTPSAVRNSPRARAELADVGWLRDVVGPLLEEAANTWTKPGGAEQ